MSTLFSRCLLLLGVFFVGVLVTPGCATLPPAQTDSFAIVDCELPGAVLRMGTGFASTGRARALRTSADDCAIRGGYYLEGAGYQTALKVWLPLAEQGDLQAQLYLGQIYEKGLGRAPDPAGAMRWYQRKRRWLCFTKMVWAPVSLSLKKPWRCIGRQQNCMMVCALSQN
jgi:hypothetical protein